MNKLLIFTNDIILKRKKKPLKKFVYKLQVINLYKISYGVAIVVVG